MKAIGQYFHVVLFITLYKVVLAMVLTFKSVGETLVCDHSNGSYRAELSRSNLYHAVQGDSNFKIFK